MDSQVTISITFSGNGVKAEHVDKLIQCWRDDMAFIGATVVNTLVTGPGVWDLDRG